MLHKAWSSIEQVPYCFWRSSVKFQGHTAKKIDDFDLDWAFPDCNSSLISSMAMKCCTKLETAKEICPIVSQGHPSNFKVTRDKTSPILTPNWVFPDYRPVAAFKSLRFALLYYISLLYLKCILFWGYIGKIRSKFRLTQHSLLCHEKMIASKPNLLRCVNNKIRIMSIYCYWGAACTSHFICMTTLHVIREQVLY